MSIEDNLFNEEISGTDLDRDTAAAAELVLKVAAVNGIDPDALSEEHYERLIKKASGNTPTTDTGPAPSDQSGVHMSDTTVTPAPATKVASVLDVTQEMTRRAEMLGIKIASLTPEQYTTEFKKLATRMSNPEQYQAELAEEQEVLKQAAAEAEAAKLADFESGRRLAHGFAEEINKLASEGKLPPWLAGKGSDKPEGKGGDGDGDDADDKGKKKEEEEKKAHDEAVIAAAREMVKKAGLDVTDFDARFQAAAAAEQKTASIHTEAVALLEALNYKTR